MGTVRVACNNACMVTPPDARMRSGARATSFRPPCRLHDRQVRRLGALEDAAGIGAELAPHVRKVGSVASSVRRFRHAPRRSRGLRGTPPVGPMAHRAVSKGSVQIVRNWLFSQRQMQPACTELLASKAIPKRNAVATRNCLKLGPPSAPNPFAEKGRSDSVLTWVRHVDPNAPAVKRGASCGSGATGRSNRLAHCCS
jgi:hypothetical protein